MLKFDCNNYFKMRKYLYAKEVKINVRVYFKVFCENCFYCLHRDFGKKFKNCHLISKLLGHNVGILTWRGG